METYFYYSKKWNIFFSFYAFQELLSLTHQLKRRKDAIIFTKNVQANCYKTYLFD